jgi:CxxC-x17-CxxC domain-containing protein
MHKGDWKCADCGTSITELPFQPDPERLGGLKCRDCHKKGLPRRSSDGPKEMHKGNWECSKCGGSITELPFQPDPSRANTLTCRDCFMKSRQ